MIKLHIRLTVINELKNDLICNGKIIHIEDVKGNRVLSDTEKKEKQIKPVCTQSFCMLTKTCKKACIQ